ncbi:MAG: hypothetical protein IJP89_02600 [Synergistaceae bacterium]|nr:hypothetical protein [Synergistaceae bacterium]
MSAFTQGTWQYNGYDILATGENSTNTHYIACMYWNGSHAEMDANARLIASAPEMFEVLIVAQEEIQQALQQGANTPGLYKALRRITAVIEGINPSKNALLWQ